MPETVADLGRKFKAKHAGAYDDLTDEEVGRKVKAKWPGDYDDFVDAPSTPIPAAVNPQARLQDESNLGPAASDASREALQRKWAETDAARGVTAPRGFFGEIGEFGRTLKEFPRQVMEFATEHPFQSMWESAGEAAQRTKEDIRNRDYSSAFGHGLAGLLTGIGGAIPAQAGEEFGSGNPGAGFAHTALALAPYRGTVREGLSRTADVAGLQSPVTVGPGRFAPKSSVLPVVKRFLPASVKAVDQLLGQKLLGGGEELAPVSKLRRLQVRSPIKSKPSAPSPIWKDVPEASPKTAAEVNPIIPEGGVLPSGRVVGPAPAPASVPVGPRQPIWAGIPPNITPPPADVTPILPEGGVLPSGRIVGPRPEPPSPPPAPARTPIWANLPQSQPWVAPEVAPILPEGGVLPSGRVVPRFNPTPEQVEAQVAKFTGRQEPPPMTPPPAASATAPSAEPAAPRLSATEELAQQLRQETAAAKSNPSLPEFDWRTYYKDEAAQKGYLNRQWHALLKDMELEGSPAGSKAPSANAAAQAVYGKDFMRLSPDQMESLIHQTMREGRAPGTVMSTPPPPMTPPPVAPAAPGVPLTPTVPAPEPSAMPEPAQWPASSPRLPAPPPLETGAPAAAPPAAPQAAAAPLPEPVAGLPSYYSEIAAKQGVFKAKALYAEHLKQANKLMKSGVTPETIPPDYDPGIKAALQFLRERRMGNRFQVTRKR